MTRKSLPASRSNRPGNNRDVTEIRLLDEDIRFSVDMDGGQDVDPDWTLEALYKVALETLELAKKTRRRHWLRKLIRTADAERSVSEARDRFASKNARQNTPSDI